MYEDGAAQAAKRKQPDVARTLDEEDRHRGDASVRSFEVSESSGSEAGAGVRPTLDISMTSNPQTQVGNLAVQVQAAVGGPELEMDT